MTLLPSLWVPKMPRLLVAIDSIAQVQVPRGATHFVAFAHGPGTGLKVWHRSATGSTR